VLNNFSIPSFRIAPGFWWSATSDFLYAWGGEEEVTDIGLFLFCFSLCLIPIEGDPLWSFNMSDNTWINSTTTPAPSARHAFSSWMLEGLYDGGDYFEYLYMYGGRVGSGTNLDEVLRLKTNTLTWEVISETTLPPLGIADFTSGDAHPGGRRLMRVALFGNYTFIFGGVQRTGVSTEQKFNDLWMFNPLDAKVGSYDGWYVLIFLSVVLILLQVLPL